MTNLYSWIWSPRLNLFSKANKVYWALNKSSLNSSNLIHLHLVVLTPTSKLGLKIALQSQETWFLYLPLPFKFRSNYKKKTCGMSLWIFSPCNILVGCIVELNLDLVAVYVAVYLVAGLHKEHRVIQMLDSVTQHVVPHLQIVFVGIVFVCAKLMS